MLLFHDQSAAHGDERPVTSLVQSWVAGIMLPASIMAYCAFHNMWLSIVAALAIPIVAIAQGSIGILKYRLLYGHGPHPITPCHGVVISSPPLLPPGAPTVVIEQTISIGGCQCSPLVNSNRKKENLNRPPRWITPIADDSQRPLRLLVLGDSLAIGVGQAKQCTPILPETIAKTISRQFKGRTVYWTCHGAPGASTGWIVRELERKQHHRPGDTESTSAFFEEETLCCSDTDESISSNESTGRVKENDDYGMWRDRILQHRRCFRPGTYLGPYDIVVVITGSNDLKSAFFPFLLTGEDAEFRRQARARGGNYTKELRRLIATLVSCMKTSTFDDSTLSPKQRAFQSTSSHSFSFSASRPENIALIPNALDGPKKPLVVFPGLPARALPVFRIAPLRWLSVPIVDILDLHKRRLGNSGEALFVPAPSLDEMADYENCQGPMWELRESDRPSLILRDIPCKDCQRISSQMREYYAEKDLRIPLHGLRRGVSKNDNPMPASGLFAVDGIHPSDDGYDFWGRYIGDAIVKELKHQQQS